MKLGEVRATVFDIAREEGRKNTVKATIRTFEGTDQKENPVYSSWRTRFVGDAYEKALGLRDKDHILITEGKVDNTYHKEREALYVNVTVFDFETE